MSPFDLLFIANFPLLTAYLHDKLEPCSFSRSRGIHKFKPRLPKLGHVPFDLDILHAVKITPRSRCTYQI